MHERTKFGLMNENPRVPATLAPALAANEARLTRIVTQCDGERDAIDADPHLSEEGKAAQRDALATRYDPVFAALDGEEFAGRSPRGLRAEIDTLRTTLASRFDAPVEGVEASLRMREIRDRLLALPDADRLRLALEAADRNDLETLRAIRHAPTAFPVLDPDRWGMVERHHRLKHAADRVATLDGLERLAEALDYNIDLARRAVRGQTARRQAA